MAELSTSLGKCAQGRSGRRAANEIGLGQHVHQLDPGFESEHDVALQPRDVEIRVAGGDDEDRVDVRRDQLHLAARPRCAALDQALALQNAAGLGVTRS